MVCMRVNESTLNTLVTFQLKFFSPRSLPLARLSLCPATWVELKKKETTKAKQSDLETLPLKQTKQNKTNKQTNDQKTTTKYCVIQIKQLSF